MRCQEKRQNDVFQVIMDQITEFEQKHQLQQKCQKMF